MSQTIRVPLHLLSITSTNARRDHIADRAMIASLKSQGLLYPLLVKGIDGSESYDVIDGARRLSCILKGLEDGELDVAQFETVPCLMNGVTGLGGLERSLHANLHQAMHPLDECEAILRLAEDEDDKAAIALRFGQDVRWLEQRVKLASLHDSVKEAFRAGHIGLGEAMDFTLGNPEQQKRFLKVYLKQELHRSTIRQEMTEKAISLKHVNFDFDQYQGPVNSDLFGDEIYLLDRRLVGELQDQWAQGEVEALKAEGYDKVEILSRDDWQTLENTVEVTGRISAEVRATLACYLKADHYGKIVVHKDRISRKKVDDKGKIKKKKESADETPAENVKPLVCTDLSPAQHEIINAYAASDLYARIEEGDETLAQFMVVDQQFGAGIWTEGGQAHRHNGTIDRWARLNKDYPAEQLIIASEIEAIGQLEPQKLDYAAWMELKPATRKALFLKACASLVRAPYGQQQLKPGLPELGKRNWLVPCGDFFKRFRTDQLIDYRKRSGDKEAGQVSKKKEAHVADCVVAAATPKGFRFGLYPKKEK